MEDEGHGPRLLDVELPRTTPHAKGDIRSSAGESPWHYLPAAAADEVLYGLAIAIVFELTVFVVGGMAVHMLLGDSVETQQAC